MGTTARVRVWAPDTKTCHRAVDAAFAAFDRVNADMSTYRDDSRLSVLNRSEPRAWVDTGGDLATVLTAAQRFHEMTDGAFDPTVFPLMRLWGFRGGPSRIPADDEIDSVLKAVGMELVEVDTTQGRAKRSRAGTTIDLGGIAKGYALDLAKRDAIEAGATSGLLDLGGNLLVFGADAAGPVAIQDPADPESVVGRVELADASVASSGGYERFVTIDGKRYGHLIDPRTGWPADLVASVTVVARDGMTADAIATACVVMGTEGCIRLVDGLAGVSAAIVNVSGDSLSIQVSEGMTVLSP